MVPRMKKNVHGSYVFIPGKGDFKKIIIFGIPGPFFGFA